MKIGILTFQNSVSYGASLQMFALYRTLVSMGHDTEIINYHNLFMKKELHCGKNGGSKRLLKRKFKYLFHYKLYSRFAQFEKRALNKYPQKSFSDMKRLSKIGKRYDAVVCGSDQVWNPDITGYDLSYFLNFCESQTKRISYAPSVGREEIPAEWRNQVKQELDKFTAVSVRESIISDMIKEMLGIHVPVVLDPTFLLNKDEWIAMEKSYRIPEGGYVLLYTIKSSAQLLNFALRLAAEKKLKVLIVGGNCFSDLKERNPMVEYAVDIGPEQWLYLIHHAGYVVTNSFHGTAFSINYRKNFFVEFSSATNSRLEQIVKTFGLQQQIVTHQSESYISETDYSVTETVLPRLREESMSFLENALN